MKKGLSLYLVSGAIIMAIAIIVIVTMGKISIVITDSANEKYMPKYIEGERGYSSPWYKDGFHIVDEGFIEDISKIEKNKKSVIVLGSSMSRIPFREEVADLINGYSYNFLVCGNGCHRSDRIFINLLDTEKLIDKDKLFKYEISFSTFRFSEKTIAESSIDKWGKYCVDENLNVKRASVFGTPLYWMNLELLKTQNVGELLFTENNFCNNYFNYEAVAASCNMQDYMKESVQEDILKLKDEANCVVELSPLPMGLSNTEYGKLLNSYIEDELIPFLEKNDVAYLDYRFDYADSEFADGVHLSYNAGVEYTKKLNNDLNKIIENSED